MNINPHHRAESLDGLRGFAALIVFFYHYLLYFYSSFSGAFYDPNTNHTGWATFLIKSPINLFFNGPLAVTIFFVISGFVLSYGYFLQPYLEKLQSGAFRRYFRLVIPIAAVELIAFTLLFFNLYFNKEASMYTHTPGFLGSVYLFAPDFIFMLKESFYYSLFTGITYPWQESYNNVLWTLHIEFLGSMLVFSILALIGKSNLRYFIYLVLFIIFRSSNLLGFILGLALADIISNGGFDFLNKNQYLNPILFTLGILFGCYRGQSSGLYYELFGFLLKLDSFIRIHVQFHVSALLIVTSILHSTLLSRLFKSSLFKFLGRISYINYLIHLPLLCSFSSYLFLLFIKSGYFEIYIVHLIVLGITIPTLFTISYIFTKWLDEPVVHFLKIAYNYFSKKESSKGSQAN